MLWALLRHALDVHSAESDTLVEEGLRLLAAAQAACSDLPQAMQVCHVCLCSGDVSAS